MAMLAASCSDGPEAGFVYSASMAKVEGADHYKKVYEIRDIYLQELGLLNKPYHTFTLTGTAEKCHAKVVKMCKKAEKKIEQRDWGFGFTFRVTTANAPYREIVYEYTYTPR